MSWETILAVITHPAVIVVVTGIAGFAIKGFRKYKKAFNAIVDIPREVLRARGHKSVGGSTITKDEWAEIGEKVVRALEQAHVLYSTRSK